MAVTSPESARKLLDGLIGADFVIAADKVADAARCARLAAQSGRNADLVRLAGVLLHVAAYADDERVELRYMGECAAKLDALADEGCEVSASLLSTLADKLTPQALALADRINGKKEAD